MALSPAERDSVNASICCAALDLRMLLRRLCFGAIAWLENYLDELTIFPNGKYDDQVDSTSHALVWFSNSNSSEF